MESRNLAVTLIFLSLIFASGCCRSKLTQPDYPNEKLGWEEFQFGGVKYMCMLVLKKGESSHNDQIGVKVVDIIPPDPCAEPNSYLGMPKAVLKFFSPSDNKVFCEATVLSGGVNLEAPSYCGPNGKVSGISVNAINTKEKWVFFALANRHLSPERK